MFQVDRYSPLSLTSEWSASDFYNNSSSTPHHYHNKFLEETTPYELTDTEDPSVGYPYDNQGCYHYIKDANGCYDDLHSCSHVSNGDYGYLTPEFEQQTQTNLSNGSVDKIIRPTAITQHAHQVFKCRQLPCRTFISTGSCPYGDRCVFLHDPSVTSKPVYIRTKVFLTV